MSNNQNPNINILKALPSHYSVGERKFLKGLLQAINGSNQNLENLMRACIDQLFIPTAQGRYLVNLAESQGFTLPQNSGLDIRAYKPLVPIMTADPKQVRITIEEIIKAFYFSERVRPSITSTINDPFSLIDGDNIILETDTGRYNIAFTESQFNDITNVSAAELAAIINATQQNIFADAPVNRINSQNFLRIATKTSGASANIRVAGGTLQNILKFPDILNTNQQAGTTYNITKSVNYTDELKIQWNGLGTNPKLYNVNKNDILTIRGLVDGIHPFSLLNGSYDIVDSGFDYVIIKNSKFNVLSSTLSQPADNSFVFTKNKKMTIFDQDEFALSSETDTNTISVTVPAIPPLARRFLKGATHLRGLISPVVDFTRNSIKITIGQGQDVPNPNNVFRLLNSIERVDFIQKSYKTISVDTNLVTPTFSVSSGNLNYTVLPFTVPYVIGSTNPIYGEIDSDELELTFSFRHGLKNKWGFTLTNVPAGPFGNITNSDLQKEHIVYFVINENKLKFRVFEPNGATKKFSGFDWGTTPGFEADLYQHSLYQPDGSDFYLEFASSTEAVASGLVPGISFKIDQFGGTNVNNYVANILRYKKMSVQSVVNNIVNISTGYGIGPFGLIISGIFGKRSGKFPGTSGIKYFFDKTSTYNQQNVLNNLNAIFYSYTKPKNPNFTNSYLYDPIGKKTKVTVSKFLAKTTHKIFRGDNLVSVNVDSVQAEDGSEFPKSGFIVLDYGFDKFEGPIKYTAIIKSPGNNQILIDPSYKFKFSHKVGTQVQVIKSNFPFSPGIDGADYPTYLTGTTTARKTMFLLIRNLLASGIFLEEDVVLPKQKYSDPSISVFD